MTKNGQDSVKEWSGLLENSQENDKKTVRIVTKNGQDCYKMVRTITSIYAETLTGCDHQLSTAIHPDLK